MKTCAFLTVLFAALTFALLTETASGSIIDFGDFAENGSPGERGYGFGDGVTVNGFSMKLFAWNTSAANLTNQSLDSATFAPGGTITTTSAQSNGPYAYLDDFFRGFPGGLGAAQNLTATNFQATPSSDDNVSAVGTSSDREVVGIQFTQDVTLESFTFRNADHDPFPENSMIDITFDNGDTWNGFAVGAGGVLNLGMGGKFVDNADKLGFAYVSTQFYLTTATATPSGGLTIIPEPLSVVVWTGLALIGMCAFRRR